MSTILNNVRAISVLSKLADPRVKILAVQNFAVLIHEINMGVKSAKICTMRKFPAIRTYDTQFGVITTMECNYFRCVSR